MTDNRPSTPRAPKGLKSAGRGLWKEITSQWELRPDELRVLAKACSEEDIIERLKKGLEEAPLTSFGSQGQEVIHPLFSEIRQHMSTQAALLRQLRLAEADAEVELEEGSTDGPMSRTESASKAAKTRWERNKKKAEG